MGNEASLEGGEGLLSGLPEGLAPDGKGGFVRLPGGTPVDLKELSEEQRRQLQVAMARAQGRQPGGAARRPSQGDVQQRSQQTGASRGPPGLSKSRTVDAFNQGPVGKLNPGRSPSSLSLFESKFRQEPKSSESKSSGMFGSSFLSGANPLSAMTSSVSSSLSSMGDAVNIPKFGIFGDEEEGDTETANASPAKGPQQQGPKGPQQGGPHKPGTGPPGQGPKQGQGPPGQGPKPGQGPQGQGPKPGQGPPGQGPKPGQGPPGQGPKQGQGPPGQGPKPGQGPPGQGPKPGQGPQGLGAKQGAPQQQKGASPPQGPGQKQQGPPGAGGQPGSTKSAEPPAQQGPGKSMPCPLCKTTQMNVGSKEPPNFNNCTECKSQVCSLCGFSPPDSAGKEWLCLNCQMQRAMGGVDPPNPKQSSVPPSPLKQAPGKPGNLLIKQQSHQSDQGLTPPTTPRQKSPGSTSPGPMSPSSSISGSPKIDPKTGKPIMPKSSPQQSPAKPKQESSFFGGLGGISLGGLTESVKPSAASSQSESVTGKLFGGFGGLMDTPKPQAQTTAKQEESVAGKLFGGFGGMSDTSGKPPAAASQMFSFGSSLLSSATNLVTGEESKPEEANKSPPESPADSGPGSPPDSPFSAPGSPPDTDSAPDTPPARFTKVSKSVSVDAEEKPASQQPKQSCPLCNIDLNIGSSDAPNYSLCTECKKTVCNLCGFNPTPHLGEKEWLCLNCQTQRALSGQLGDAPPAAMASPKKQPQLPAAPTTAPVPPDTPAPPASVETKPVVEPSDPNPAAPDTKVQNLGKDPTEKESAAKDNSLTRSSDLAKLESTVLPILEAQPKQEVQKSEDTPKTRRKLEVLPMVPDSPSSEEEREIPEEKAVEKKKLLVPMDIRGDSLEDSSESIGKDSPASVEDEDFIRKQIVEMSENEDVSPTDEEVLIQQKIKEQENKRDILEKSNSGKVRRLTKKATISPDDDEDKHLQDAVSKPADDTKQEVSGTPVRTFQTMELNAQSIRIVNTEGEVEIENLIDSPDDRSKGEGSSSLHASSFTPGTSPTSVSSFDEDSDSSSPSNVPSGEGKQQRKAKHRQPGQLPTIEDSSEEDELREEEELLREQEKQRGSGKKSKKDKEDKSQRRRERSKTPPSNLSPIEDASPTEEQRQEAEMEEIRRSSCSDFSPSFDSDLEGFESHAQKIAAVQKSYKLPVSFHSPTEEKTQKKQLKSADEAYEEIMLRAKSPTTEKVDNQQEKDSLYGGMLIEDYAYTSLIDKSTNDMEESEKIVVPAQPKKLRSPDEVYEDMLQKRKEFQKLEEEYKKIQPKQEQQNPTPEIVLQPAENISKPMTVKDIDGKPLLDADTAYEELMKKALTPGSSPTQQDPAVEITSPRRALHPIPDLKVTQCSSGELSSDDESFYKKEEEQQETSEKPPVCEPIQDSSPEPSADTTITSHQAAVDLSSLPRTSTPLMGSVTPLPTVPQYTPGVQSVVSTAPPIPPKPQIMRRGSSQDNPDMPVAPPPTPPKPTVFPRKAPVPLPPQASTYPIKPDDPVAMTQGSPTRHPTVTPTYKVHVPPPVPPKPCIHSGISEGPRTHGVKPPIAPKPGSQPTSPAHVSHPPRPTMLPTGSGPTEIALNLSPTSEQKPFHSLPKSPPSPRYASNVRDTYVVITLPSQPSSPVDTISTQAPSSPSLVSPSHQTLPQSCPQPQHQAHQPQQATPQSSRVPLAYTRVTESIENQEICSPEKHVSSSCHIIEAISASAQPPIVTPNLISQVVTTEVQRTTVSVVHERAPPPVPAPRANGVPLDKSKPQVLVQTTQAVQPCEVVDLRTMKVDQQSNMNGVDLSAGLESRRQSYATDTSRQNSAVQSPVVNLSAESSTVSIVTDSITIVTCAATIQRWDNAEPTQASSVPLQLTKTKSFEPVSQIVYRPVDSQPSVLAGPEIPINLSVGSGAGTFQSAPVTTVPPILTSCAANGLTTGTTTVAGAVDLSTTKPFNTVVSVDGASSEVVTAVITDDDGKPVDLTAGKRAVCCDVVYNLPFARSCTSQQPATSLPEDRFGYRDDHYQYDRTPYGLRGFGGIKPSMSDTNLAEAGLFFYKSKNSYNYNSTTDGAVDLTSAKITDSGEAVDYSKKPYEAMTIPPYSDTRTTSAVGTVFGTTNVLRSSNGIVYSSVGSPIPSTYAITTQPGSIFSTTYNHQSGMHTSDTMPSLSNLQNMPLTRSHSFLSTISTTDAEAPLNLELSRVGTTCADSITAASLTLDTYTDASLEAIAASLEALSSPMVTGDGQYQAERERLEMEKLKQQRLAEELERERQEIQRFREHEQVLVQKEIEELQAMKQQILNQQEEERQAHLLMQKETYAQQQQQLEQIQRLQEQLRLQLEEQKLRQMYPSDIQEAVVLGPDGTVLARKITDSGCQTDEEDETISKAYTAGRKKKNAKKSVDSSCQTDDEDQEEWEENRNRRPRTARGDRSAQSEQGNASTSTGTQKKVKRTLPNPPSEEESSTTTTTTAQTAYSTNSARRRMCRNSNMARAKILQDIDRELDLVERESSKLRKRQAELDEEEKEIDAKLRYLEMGINRRKDALLKEREKRERAYLQSVADERDYMSDSEVSHIRETRSVIGAVEDEEIVVHGLERPRTAPQSELDEFGNPQDKNEFDKYSQYPYTQSQYQQSLYQTPQSYQSQSIYSSVPSLTSSQQQSYHQMLLLQQKAARQAALLSELDATKYDVINRQPDATSSAYLGVKYDKYGNHLDLRALDVGGVAGTPMSAVSDTYYQDVDHHTPRSYMLLEDAAELAKGSTALSSSYSLAERELAKAEKLLRRSAADLGSTDYLGSTSRLHTYGKTPDEEETMEEPYELKLLKQQLKQEFRRSTGSTENLEQHYYTPTTGLSSYSQRSYPKSEKYSISRLTLEKQAAKQLPASVLYQKHKTPLIDPKLSSKYSSVADRALESEYTSYLGSSGSPRTSRLMQDEITFGLRKNIAEQQKYLGSNLGANLAGSLNLGQSLGLDSAYPSGSRSRPPSRPTSCYGLDLSIKRDPSSSSLRLKGDGESGDGSSYQTPSGRTKPTSLPIVQSGRGRIPIVAQNSEEESPLSPVGQPMGMARASAGPLPPISADSRDQFGSCLSLQDSQQQQQFIREEPTRGRSSVILDDLQGTMSDSEAYHLQREETDWFEKPRDGRPDAIDKKQGKGPYYPFPHLRVKLQRDPKDRTVSGNGLGIRIVGGKEVPNGNGDIGAYVAKVLPGGAAEQTGKILEGMQVVEWNGVLLTGKTYEEVQGLVSQPCNEAEVCVRLDLNMLAESGTTQNLNLQEHSKSERPPRSPGVDPQQLAAELQKVSQQQAPSVLPSNTSSTSSPVQPGSPSISKKRHSSKSADGAKTHPHPVSGEIQLQIHYDKQLGNLIIHVLQARNLSLRDNNGFSDPFVKVYLLPGRGAENKRRSKHAGKCINPEWNQTVIYKNIHLEQLKKKTLEVSVWDYDKSSSNDFLGEVLIDLSNTSQLDNVPRWLSLKEQSEGDHHRRSHSGQNRHSSRTSSQHSSPKTGSTHDVQDSTKSSVTKSRSHGVFPDPAKGQRGRFPLRHQRHSVVGVLTVQRTQSDWLPTLPPVFDRRPSDNRHVTLRKAWSEERPQSSGARSAYRSGETPVTAASLDSGLSGSVYSLLDEEAEANEVDSAIFHVPRIGKITNGTDLVKSSMGHNDGGGKSHVMGEIKIALKKEVKTEGDHLILEILQCRNITYKFKSPDHLPDLYVKLYVVNIATQKRIIKKKTRVCRHDREPSFNETFRFCMNPTGHALQLFLVSNGGKFVKKTLIGEAYVWLDKVDLRKRVVSWHKLHASTAQIHS